MSKLKLIINLVTLGFLALLIYASWDQVTEAFSSFQDISWWILLLQLPLQLAGCLAIAHLFHAYFKQSAARPTYTLKDLYRVSLELNFVNHVFPGGGINSFSYLSLRMKPYRVSVAESSLAQSLRLILVFTSFLLFLGLGLVMLAVTDQANNLVMLIGSSMFGLVTFGIATFAYLVSGERRIKSFLATLPRAINYLVTKLRLRSKNKAELLDIARIEKMLVEFNRKYKILVHNLGRLKTTFLWALIFNFVEIVAIYLAYVALGGIVNPGAIILAYAVANLASLVAIIPGNIGIYEGSVTGTLGTVGISGALALAGIAIFRVVKLFILVPIGFIYYQLALHRGQIHRPKTIRR